MYVCCSNAHLKKPEKPGKVKVKEAVLKLVFISTGLLYTYACETNTPLKLTGAEPSV